MKIEATFETNTFNPNFGQIQDLTQDVYDEGYIDGYNSGWQDGYNEGYDAGYEYGYDSGNEHGYQEGHMFGYDEGYHEGERNGYLIGFGEGWIQGEFNGMEMGYYRGYDDGHTAGRQEGIDIGYKEGYEEGYDAGRTNGFNDGYESGYLQSQKDINKELTKIIAEQNKLLIPPDSEGLEKKIYENGSIDLIGRGTCVDEVIKIPEGVYVSESFYTNDNITKTLYIYARNFSTLYIHNTIENIYLYAGEGFDSFAGYGIKTLKYVQFPSEFSYMAGGNFSQCNNVVYDFTCVQNVPELFTYGPGSEFGTNPVIKVPFHLYNEWMEHSNWENYRQFIVAVENQELIDKIKENDQKIAQQQYLLGQKKSSDIIAGLVSGDLTEIIIPEEVSQIRPYAFYGINTLQEITIPNNIIQIGNYAFYGCEALKQVYIGDNVTNISDYSFAYCHQLSKMVFGGNLQRIGKYGILSYRAVIYDFRKAKFIPLLSSSSTISAVDGTQIVVPDELYDQWRKAPYWSTHSSFIIKASEYIE